MWLEEPITPDDYAGYAHLRSLGLVPLAAGENLHTLGEFAALVNAGGIDFPEPDLTTCGGITPFMKVAKLCEANNLPVMSHGAHDLHIHCLAAAPNAASLEWHAFGLDRFMADPLTVSAGYATAPGRPGPGRGAGPRAGRGGAAAAAAGGHLPLPLVRAHGGEGEAAGGRGRGPVRARLVSENCVGGRQQDGVALVAQESQPGVRQQRRGRHRNIHRRGEVSKSNRLQVKLIEVFTFIVL